MPIMMTAHISQQWRKRRSGARCSSSICRPPHPPLCRSWTRKSMPDITSYLAVLCENCGYPNLLCHSLRNLILVTEPHLSFSTRTHALNETYFIHTLVKTCLAILLHNHCICHVSKLFILLSYTVTITTCLCSSLSGGDICTCVIRLGLQHDLECFGRAPHMFCSPNKPLTLPSPHENMPRIEEELQTLRSGSMFGLIMINLLWFIAIMSLSYQVCAMCTCI